MNLPDFLTRGPHGEIRLTGHRIDLLHIIEAYNEGLSAEAIGCEYPTLSLLQIYKTITFYLENLEAVDAYVSESETLAQAHMAAAKPAPSLAELRRRLEARRLETA